MKETFSNILQDFLRLIVHPVFEHPVIAAVIAGLIIMVIGYLAKRKKDRTKTKEVNVTGNNNITDIKDSSVNISNIGRQINQTPGSTYNETNIKDSTITDESVTLNHNGSGDIVLRDKVIHQHLYGSIDYQKLIDDIAYNKKILKSIPENDDAGRLSVSEKISQLEGQLESFKEDVFRLYETFFKIPINTKRLKQAKKLFDEGKFREADVILKSEEMYYELEAADRLQNEGENNINEAQQIRDNIANEFLIKAQLWTTFYDEPDWFEKANQYYEQALQASRNVYTLFEYALFLHHNNQHSKAKPLYEETVVLYKELAKKNPDKYLAEAAGCITDLGSLYKSIGDYEEASKHYKEALEIFEDLQQKNPTLYLSDIAGALNNIGELFSRIEDRIYEAESTLLRSIEYYGQISELYPSKHLLDSFRPFNNYGNILSKRGQYNDAVDYYKRALKIQLEYSDDSFNCLSDIAMTLTNLANTEVHLRNMSKAQEFFLHALDLRRKLAKNLPSAYLPGVAMTLVNFSIFHTYHVKDKIRAIAMAKECMEIAKYFPCVPDVQGYSKKALQVLQANGVNTDELFNPNNSTGE